MQSKQKKKTYKIKTERKQNIRSQQKENAARPPKKGRFASQNSKSIDLDTLEEEEEEEEAGEGGGEAQPDAAAALQTLSVIKARISAEMEEHLGVRESARECVCVCVCICGCE